MIPISNNNVSFQDTNEKKHKAKYYTLSKEDFLERATLSFEKKGVLDRVDASGISIRSENELLEQLFARYQGICVGEFHDDPSTKDFMVRNMHRFKEMGVTTLFYEGFNELEQASLDTCTTDKLSAQKIREKMSYWYNSSRNKAVVNKALQYGIRIVGIDVVDNMKVTITNKHTEQIRWVTMNYVAAKTIKREKGTGKYVAFMGNNHLNNHQAILGISELIQAPSIAIMDSYAEDCIVRDYKVGSSSHGANFALVDQFSFFKHKFADSFNIT